MVQSRSDDFAQMVDRSGCESARKSVAMNFVDKLRALEGEAGGSIEALSEAFIALAPMQLENYLKVPKPAAVATGKAGIMVALVKHGGLPGVIMVALVQFAPEIKSILQALAR